MKIVFFALTTLLLVACGNNTAPPEPAEEDSLSTNLPDYRLLSTEEPRVSSNGHISPAENLIYNIEIDHPLENDSLKLLQDYFIKKGKTDFGGINKIIVRAYLEGTTIHGTPYASMNFIGDNKEIIVNDEVKKLKKLTEAPSTKTSQEATDPMAGTFFCDRTHDTYVFKSDKTGVFTIQGGSPTEFTWKRSGNSVIIKYESFGEQKLTYDPKDETLKEKSESFGTLIFKKQ